MNFKLSLASLLITYGAVLLLTGGGQLASCDESVDTFWRRAANTIKTTIAPEVDYLRLLYRYNSWFHSYKSITDSSMRDARDIILEEYAKVDRELLTYEACTMGAKEDPNKIEGVDHVFKVLHTVIERLEASLSNLRDGGMPMDIESGDGPSQMDIDGESHFDMSKPDGEEVHKALERAQKAVLTSAKRLVDREFHTLTRIAVASGIALASSAASSMAANPQPGFQLGEPAYALILPILKFVGTASSVLLVNYLRSIKARVAFNVMNRFDLVNLTCKIGSNIKFSMPNFLKRKQVE